MRFFDRLQEATIDERQNLFATPFINDSVAGLISVQTYAAYLCQAYQHVKHTLPLLMAAGSRLPDDKEWLRDALAEYIAEEQGHQEWILNDIEACGYDREAARNIPPTLATELMVAYAYDLIHRVGPIGFFGMVQVLEGTSVEVAEKAADSIQQTLELPDGAFTYLRSHGKLDQEHMKFFEGLMNKIDDASDQQAIIHCANVFYRLFGDVLRSVSADQICFLLTSSAKEKK
jgi:pyrroloquinoline quinone (PQQ) biosynthesis protein C